jgi:hypothetical protein
LQEKGKIKWGEKAAIGTCSQGKTAKAMLNAKKQKVSK